MGTFKDSIELELEDEKSYNVTILSPEDGNNDLNHMLLMKVLQGLINCESRLLVMFSIINALVSLIDISEVQEVDEIADYISQSIAGQIMSGVSVPMQTT